LRRRTEDGLLSYDQKALDDQYEQRVWVPHAEDIIRRYGEAE
jgi:hypothetical protein